MLFRRLFLIFAVVALAARTLVPAGWMPSQAGAFTFELCSDGKAATAWIDADGKLHKQKPGDGAGKHPPCAFASVAAADFAPAYNDAPSLKPVAAAAILAVVEIAPGRGLAAPPPPQTGPPLLI